MDTDPEVDLQGDNSKFLYKEETHAIIGCRFEILNEHGNGLHEKIYENSLVVEFELRNIAYEQQKVFEVRYKDRNVGKFIPDLIAYDKIIADTKVIPKITDRERGQMLNYLKITGLRAGLIMNFYHPRLEYVRVVN